MNPEIALNKTIDKFIDRFGIVELEAKKLGLELENMTLEEMDALWNEAKLHRN